MYDIEKTWPKWKIVRLIGEGSFGKVFEIYRNEFGIEEHSALKVISIPQSDSEVQSLKNDGMTDQDTTEYFKGIVSDFVQEIQLMSQLKGSANVVAYEDFAVIEKTDSIGFDILIRMELLTGLPKYLRENQFRVIDVIQLGIDMCRALEVCRVLNIVHRDIKPDNIFVSANGSFKLGDFGVARTIEKTMAGLSRKGTYSYMAPEIYNGKEYGFEADIYSLGIVLYKMLNNNRDPFLPAYPAPVKYSDKTEAMVKRIQGLPLPKPENADEKLSNIIFKACAHNPEYRYHHPSELRADLEAIAAIYLEFQSEVFSENGINYYTNNSIFGTVSSKAPLPENKTIENSQAGDEAKEGTMVIMGTPNQDVAVSDAPSVNVVVAKAPNDVIIMESEPTEDTMIISAADANIVFGTTAIEANDVAEKSVAPDIAPIIPPQPVAPQPVAPQPVATQPVATQPVATQPAPPPPVVVPPAVNTPQTKQCPICHMTIRAQSLFCGYCGHNLAMHKQPQFCPRCAHELKPGVHFCSKCGLKL